MQSHCQKEGVDLSWAFALDSQIQGKACGSEVQNSFCIRFSSKGNQAEIPIPLNPLSTTRLGFFIAVFVLCIQSI